MLVGITLMACEKKVQKSEGEFIRVNGKTYDLSKGCNQIMVKKYNDAYKVWDSTD